MRDEQSSSSTIRRIVDPEPDWQGIARIQRSRQAVWRQLARMAGELRTNRRRELSGGDAPPAGAPVAG